jgi:hypothetical protein
MSGRALQILGSLLVAIAIVAVTIVVASARIGPGASDDSGGHGGRSGQEDRGAD